MDGRIYGPYTGTYFASTSENDIDHIVYRSEASDSGLCVAGSDTERSFSSDLLNLTLSPLTSTAISLSAQAARQRIRQGSAAAVAQHRENPIAPLVWPGPYLLEKRFFHTDKADAEMSKAGAERVDAQSVRFRSDDILDIVYR